MAFVIWFMRNRLIFQRESLNIEYYMVKLRKWMSDYIHTKPRNARVQKTIPSSSNSMVSRHNQLSQVPKSRARIYDKRVWTAITISLDGNRYLQGVTGICKVVFIEVIIELGRLVLYCQPSEIF